ncbi:hypothetical protein D8M06_12410 [Oceanobacillus halophilus]|uniref:Uncharacterized protein n=1 Tax=Oceanobacillus halophilus TaxID=930130 RepID=A0A495A0D7_9BACI|nr:hypothetical protein D8M06_12410 [Oceanobacillus halophilus]
MEVIKSTKLAKEIHGDSLKKEDHFFSACDVTLPRRSLSCGKKSIGETALCVSTKEAHQLPAESVVYFRSED